jgi:hypothetical protein
LSPPAEVKGSKSLAKTGLDAIYAIDEERSRCASERVGIDGVNLPSGYGSMTRGEGAHLRCTLRASPASRRQARAAICDGAIVVLEVQCWQRELD